MKKNRVTTLFVDVGGVLLTNGWDRQGRKLAAETFNIDLEDMEARHHLTFDTFEVGKLSLHDYLKRIVFYKKRSFSESAFENFIYSQSKAYPEMLELLSKLKAKYKLKIAIVSNEGRELTEYRIKKFKLNRFVDFYISSCFVHLRKPDVDIYRLALDIAQVDLKEVLYLDDREMFVQVAQSLGIKSHHHIDYKTTIQALAKAGLTLELYTL